MTLPRRHHRGVAFRAHHPRWAYDPLSGEGARRHGGRFNPPGTAALYLSLRLETAWLEAQQGFAFKAQPMTMCAYRLDMADLLDLADPTVLAGLGITATDLGCAWELLAADRAMPPSWVLATRLIGEGIAGIRVRSYAAGAGAEPINLVSGAGTTARATLWRSSTIMAACRTTTPRGGRDRRAAPRQAAFLRASPPGRGAGGG